MRHQGLHTQAMSLFIKWRVQVALQDQYFMYGKGWMGYWVERHHFFYFFHADDATM